MDAVKIDRVHFAYRETPILRDITLAIPEGAFVGFVGPNGGGKTTLLNLMMGFIKPQSGTVSIYGTTPEKARPLIGYVPQVFRYDTAFPISVQEVVLTGRLRNLPWWGHFRNDDKNAAQGALERVGMGRFSKALFAELSGGQAQRVLIARALVSKPKILLLDEPTASVDPKAQSDIYNLLDTFKGNLTICMVTHDLKTALDHVEKVFCVQQEVRELHKDEVCQHFALGLYHPKVSR